MKYSKSESGRLGAIKSNIVQKQKMEQRLIDYSNNPKLCKECSTPIEYKFRYNVFCCKSCSASYNNKLRTRDYKSSDTGKIVDEPPIICNYCLNCNSSINKEKSYCNNKCQQEYNFKIDLNSWLGGNLKHGIKRIKKFVIHIQGYSCSNCNLTSWMENDIVLELEHKDGNSENNTIDNLCLLCPNCHSQTKTYKGRNIGNGRHSRRIRYKEGKSY